MKRLFYLLVIVFSNSLISQNIWEPIILPDTIESYNICAEKDGVIFIGATANNGTTGLFKSIDNGISWSYLIIDTLTNINYINVIGYDYDEDLFVGTNFGWYKSMDDGGTFEKVSQYTGSIMNLVISPDNSLYGLGWVGIIRSSDKGITWDTLYTAEWNQYFHDIDFGLDGELFAVGDKIGTDCTGFFKSTDNGISWEENGPELFGLQSVKVNDNGTIIISGYMYSENTYHSYDNGLTWELASNICADEMETYANDLIISGRHINDYNGCWYSQDWGFTWESLTDSILNPNVSHISVSPSNIVFIQSEANPSYEHSLFRSINPLVGVNKKSPYPEIRLSPNPISDKISISNDTGIANGTFVVYSINGQQVTSGTFINNYISLSILKSGIYIIEIEIDKKSIRKKIIKK